MAHSTAFRRFIRLLQHARRLNLQSTDNPPPSPRSTQRRQFLKNTVLSGVALSSLGSISSFAGTREQKVVVVGAGLAGLNAAFQLSKAGVRATIYEARSRVGGRMRSVEGIVSEGIVTDLGGELVNTDHDDMHALLSEFGLTLTERQQHNGALESVGYFFNGRRRTEAEMANALQPLAAQIMTDSELLDSDWDTWGPVFDNQSLKDYLDQHSDKLPADPDIRFLIEALVRVEYGVEPSKSSALQLLYLLPVVDGEQVELLSNSDEAWTIDGGSERLIHSLRNVLQDQIHLDSPLTSIEKTSKGYTLTFNCKNKVHATYVVLALPLNALSNVDIRVQLPKSLRRFICEVNLGRNEKIVAGVNERIWRSDEGFALEAWNNQSVALLWDSSLRELNSRDNGALTFFLGGNEVKANAGGSAQARGQALIQEYNKLLPGLQESANGKFVRTAWHKTPGIQGGYTNFKPGQYTGFASQWMHVEAEDPSERQVPRVKQLVLAGEHTSDEYYGFMNGAAQTGRLAANWIMEDMLKKHYAGK